MIRRNIPDVLGGVLTVLVSLPFFIKSFDYGIGASTSMLPGFFPAAASGILILLGLALTIKGLSSAGVMDKVEWRPVLAISLSIVTFVFGVTWFGLIPGAAALVVVSTLATDQTRPLVALLLALVTSLIVWIIFGLMLGLPIPMFKGFA